MSFPQAEIERRLANLIVWGTIKEADYPAARVRVECGGVLTDWLPWATQRAGSDARWWAPEVGEQVVILSPSGELTQGIVLCGVFQASHPAPADSPDVDRRVYADGAVIEYDRANHVLRADIPGDVDVKAAKTIKGEAKDIDVKASATLKGQAGASITLTAPTINLLGNISSMSASGGTGTVTEKANRTTEGNCKIIGDLEVDGSITATGSILADGDSDNHHEHPEYAV